MQIPQNLEKKAMSAYYLGEVVKIVKNCEEAKAEEIGSEYGKEQAELMAYKEIKEWLFGDT